MTSTGGCCRPASACGWTTSGGSAAGESILAGGTIEIASGGTLSGGTWIVHADATLTTLANVTTNQATVTLDGANSLFPNFDAVAATKVIGAFASADALKVFDAGMKRIARYILQPSFPDQTGFELFANGDFGFVAGGVRTLKTHA